LQARRFSRPVP